MKKYLLFVWGLLWVCTARAHFQDLKAEAGMPNLSITFSTSELLEQARQYSSNITGYEALKIALQVLLTDSDSPETPLSLFSEAGEDVLLGLNRSSAELFLVHADNLDRFKPEHGESIQHSWIFCLSLPDFSDHLYWIVVERNGNRPAYVYGFN